MKQFNCVSCRVYCTQVYNIEAYAKGQSAIHGCAQHFVHLPRPLQAALIWIFYRTVVIDKWSPIVTDALNVKNLSPKYFFLVP